MILEKCQDYIEVFGLSEGSRIYMRAITTAFTMGYVLGWAILDEPSNILCFHSKTHEYCFLVLKLEAIGNGKWTLLP